MASMLCHYSRLCMLVLAIACLATPIECSSHHKAALFVFGDSVFDPGNNNYINTTAEYQANYWPYGESFLNYPALTSLIPAYNTLLSNWLQYSPTGRFSDGHLIPDFIAKYAHLPLIPPYFHIHKKDFVHGVNFASGGSGCLAETNAGHVIDLETQLKYFKNVAQLLKKKVGATESKQILSSAVYMIATGNNDYSYYLKTGSLIPGKEFVQVVMGNITSALKGIYEEGGRKFALLTLLPLGCIPSSRAANNGSCLGLFTKLEEMHNAALPEMLNQLEKELPGFKYTVLDMSKVLYEITDHPTKYGFKTTDTACCGMGPFRGVYSCGGRREVKEYELCENVRDYLYFDSVHPTQRAYKLCAELMWNGGTDVVAPYNLRSFFKLSA